MRRRFHPDDHRAAGQDAEEFSDSGLGGIGRHVGRAETDSDLRAADGVDSANHIAFISAAADAAGAGMAGTWAESGRRRLPV